MTFIITPKLTHAEARDNIAQIQDWFDGNPTRRICHTDLGWNVRRKHIIEDVLKHTQDPEGFWTR